MRTASPNDMEVDSFPGIGCACRLVLSNTHRRRDKLQPSCILPALNHLGKRSSACAGEVGMASRNSSKQSPPNRIPPLRLAFALNVLLACFVFLPPVNANIRLAWSIVGGCSDTAPIPIPPAPAGVRTGRILRYEFLARPVHYVQLTMHSCIYAYWGWYWREVYHQIPLIIAQLVFAYVLDMLVCWSRRDKWILGFGPFPIVLSTNLFLWFKPDWFFLQFLMLATGVLCKEFITWTRDGRRAHIFNPSAVALFIFSVGLIVTHSTQITWGEEIAVSFDRPPHIYLEIFLLGLVVQALFSVTLVTLSAAAALYAHEPRVHPLDRSLLLYRHQHSGRGIPWACTCWSLIRPLRPARALARSCLARCMALAVFGLYWLLGWLGAPTFYDKLLCVPPLNLTVRALDRASVALAARFRMPVWTPRHANFAHMGVWICLFAVMFATGFLGSNHPGADPEFWRKACLQGRGTACQTWVRKMNMSCSMVGAGVHHVGCRA